MNALIQTRMQPHTQPKGDPMADVYSAGAAVLAANTVIGLYVYMAFNEVEDPPYEEPPSGHESKTENNIDKSKSKQSWMISIYQYDVSVPLVYK